MLDKDAYYNTITLCYETQHKKELMQEDHNQRNKAYIWQKTTHLKDNQHLYLRG